MRLGVAAHLSFLLLAAALGPGCNESVSCEDPNQFGIILDGPEAASTKVTKAFRDANIDALFDIEGVSGHGVGLCCAGDWPTLTSDCLSLSMQRRGATGAALMSAVRKLEDGVRALQRADPVAAKHEIPVSIEVEGLSGPRCSKGPACGPIAYANELDASTRAPTGERVPVPIPSVSNFDSGPACKHDGDCILGCEFCNHWTKSGLACRTVLYESLLGSFCGCVNSRCSLFR